MNPRPVKDYTGRQTKQKQTKKVTNTLSFKQPSPCHLPYSTPPAQHSVINFSQQYAYLLSFGGSFSFLFV